MQPLDEDLVRGIIDGTIVPNHNQMWYGTISGKDRAASNTYKAVPGSTVYRRGMKQGGKVAVKPLPAKLQFGSKLMGAPIPADQPEIELTTPLSTPSNLWETLDMKGYTLLCNLIKM